MSYERWHSLTGNSPPVMFNQRLGNPAFTCVQPVQHAVQPICPHTDGRALVFPLISTTDMIFVELVPGVYNRSGDDDARGEWLSASPEGSVHPIESLFKWAPESEDEDRSREFLSLGLLRENESEFVFESKSDSDKKAELLFLKNHERMGFPNLVDPVIFRKYLSPIPRDMNLLGELWIDWLDKELFVPVCLTSDIKTPYLRCPDNYIFGPDGFCKPTDFGELFLQCPPDFVLYETSLPGQRTSGQKLKRNGKDTNRPFPRCVGQSKTVTNYYCPDSLLIDMHHKLCLDVKLDVPSIRPDEEQLNDMWGLPGKRSWRAVSDFMRNRLSPNLFPFVQQLVPMKIFKQLFESVYSDMKNTRLHVNQNNSRHTRVHSQWFEAGILRDWLHNKRDQQGELLIAVTADILSLAGSPQPPRSPFLGHFFPTAEREEVARRYGRSALEIVRLSVDPYLRPRLERYRSIQIDPRVTSKDPTEKIFTHPESSSILGLGGKQKIPEPVVADIDQLLAFKPKDIPRQPRLLGAH